MAQQKTAVTTKVKAQVDLIVKSSNAIEKLTKVKAFAMVSDLLNENDFNLFRVGGALAVIQDNGWFHDEGYESLKDFVEARYGMQYRKAMYWIQIYKNLVENEIPWDKVKDIGWSKLRMISDILTLENLEEYVELSKDMTQSQLADFIRQQKKGTIESPEGKAPPKEDTIAEVKKLSTVSFKVHEDQKEIINEALDTAKNQADTEYDAVAFEAICMNFLSKDTKPTKTKGYPTLRAAMKASTYEEVFEIFEELWPDIELSVTIPDGDEVEEVD